MNTAGIANAKKVGKYVGKFDVITMQEICLEIEREKELEKKLNKAYTWNFKAAERIHKKGRAKGAWQ